MNRDATNGTDTTTEIAEIVPPTATDIEATVVGPTRLAIVDDVSPCIISLFTVPLADVLLVLTTFVFARLGRLSLGLAPPWSLARLFMAGPMLLRHPSHRVATTIRNAPWKLRRIDRTILLAFVEREPVHLSALSARSQLVLDVIINGLGSQLRSFVGRMSQGGCDTSSRSPM